MSVQGNIAPGSGARVSTANMTERRLLGDAVTSTGRFSILGMGRVSVSIMQTAGVPGATFTMYLYRHPQASDPVDEITIMAVGTPYSMERHVAGSQIEIRMDNAVAGSFTVNIQATGTS